MVSTILIVDDDAALAEMAGIVLEGAGHRVEFCHDGGCAMKRFRQVKPDLVLLDFMLPIKDGITVCREMRAESQVPIIMLTARSDTQDVVLGLEAGADDYVPKPFKPAELLARIMARLRAVPAVQAPEDPPAESLRVGPLTVNLAEHTASIDGRDVPLTPLEFDLLSTMAQRPRQVFSREELLEKVWGYQFVSDTRLVNVHMQRLRSKLERDPEAPELILTVRGVGYKIGQ